MNSISLKSFSPSQLPADSLDRIRIERAQRSIRVSENQRLAEIGRDAASVRQRCKKLSQFVREAWASIPSLRSVPYVHGWHIDFLCAHLEAVTFGRLLALGHENRLLANVPPGMMKSLLVAVFWPAWEWAYGFAHYQYIVTSYREDYCTRDTSRMRDLVISNWYQRLYGQEWFEGEGASKSTYPGVTLTHSGDTSIANTAGGWRMGVPFGSLVGNRADRVIIDDPHSIDTAESDKDRERTTMRFRERAMLSVNDAQRSAIVMIMQRLHVNDLSGVALKFGMGFTHVMLPLEFEPGRRCVTPIGRDPRQHEGELLFAERFPAKVVAIMKRDMTAYAVDGQLQQRPISREGRMFKREWFAQTVPAAPTRARRARGWDLAASIKKTGKFTAGMRMSIDKDEIIYIEHVVRGRFTPADGEKIIKLTARTDDEAFPAARVRVSIPQDPGQAGIAQINAYAKALAGRDVRFSTESGDKRDRALPLSAQAELGRVRIVQTGDPALDAWIEPLLDELMTFPSGQFTDQGDAASRAYATLLQMPMPIETSLFITEVGNEDIPGGWDDYDPPPAT